MKKKVSKKATKKVAKVAKNKIVFPAAFKIAMSAAREARPATVLKAMHHGYFGFVKKSKLLKDEKKAADFKVALNALVAECNKYLGDSSHS
jgi:hypothetical protein